MYRIAKFLLTALITVLLSTYSITACAVHSKNMNGSINGVVTDEAGRPIEGVGVGIDQTTAQGPIREILPVTNEEGKFAWPALPPGTYTLRASKSGYKSQTQTVEVKDDETAKVEFKLQRDN